RPLSQDADGVWGTTLKADEVNDGLWYKVTGGDAETPVYRVTVRARPHVTRFEVTYRYRPYLCRKDRAGRYGPSESLQWPDMKEPRGTEVSLVARTNRDWRSGHLLL